MKRRTKEKIFYLVSVVASISTLLFSITERSKGHMAGVFETITLVLLFGTLVFAVLDLIPNDKLKEIKKSSKYRLAEKLLPVLAGAFVIPATVFRGIVTYDFYWTYNTLPCLFVILTSVLVFPVTKMGRVSVAPVSQAEIVARRLRLKKSGKRLFIMITLVTFCALLFAEAGFLISENVVSEIRRYELVSTNDAISFKSYAYYDDYYSYYSGNMFEISSLSNGGYEYDYYNDSYIYKGCIGDRYKVVAYGDEWWKEIKNYKLTSSDESIVEIDGQEMILKSAGTATITMKKHLAEETFQVKVLGAGDIYVSDTSNVTYIQYDERYLIGIDCYNYGHDLTKAFEFKVTGGSSATVDVVTENGIAAVYFTGNEAGNYYVEMYYGGTLVGKVKFSVMRSG